ncbi:MAG: MBL fold metallo-hydrolase [Planctomycetes bacterium]|nr:MBL fold metallo-hydrolase [Planctomycetota bacterium]
MQIRIISSGSKGNSMLFRAGDMYGMVDAGLTLRALTPRLEEAGVPFRGLDHILVTHGHLDHARSAGALAKRHHATVHCPEAMMQNRSVARAPRLSNTSDGMDTELLGEHGDKVRLQAVALPHDCHPTLAYKLTHDDRCLVVLSDIGRPDRQVAQRLSGAHVLMLEFNHCTEMLEAGPYPDSLKRRVGGDQGHLSNEQSQEMLTWLAGENLHTLVLTHLSAKNNQPEIALNCAMETLDKLGLSHIKVLIAKQEESLEPIQV